MECRDEGEEVSEDSEDSNAEDYYDRICEAYGEEECNDSDYREDWEQGEYSYGINDNCFSSFENSDDDWSDYGDCVCLLPSL